MKIYILVMVAFSALRRNKMRSFLTMLGVIIGVASVISMLAIGEGSNHSIQQQISSMGTNLLHVQPLGRNRGGVKQSSDDSQSLSIRDAEAIQKHGDKIEYVSPEVDRSGQAIFGANNWPTQVFGGNEDYATIKKLEVSSGRLFTSREITRAAKVCLLGQTVAENLFDDVDPVGRTIRFEKIPMQIIGILAEKGENTFGQDQDDIILAPYTTVMKRLSRKYHLRAIVMSAYSADQIEAAADQAEEIMRNAHRLKEGKDNDFEIKTQSELIERFSSVSQMMLVLLGSIAAISLIVGGIGIMNIMYVSVTERTREIGLRLAIGGKGYDILMQFLIEAIMLSITGGILGVWLGYLSSYLVDTILGWPVMVSSQSVLLSFFCCTVIGVFFGWYPARKASRLNPIDALRHE